MLKKLIFPFIVYSLITQTVSASENNTVTVAFGNTLSPWVMKDGSSGILVDLLKDCLEPSGYIIEPVLLPYARRIKEFANNRVDVVTDINSKSIKDYALEGYFTGNLYAYENMAFSLAENHFSIDSISDLKGHSVVSWHGAASHLGSEYARMAKNNPMYLEVHQQMAQIEMLYKKRTDFIQLDFKIFEFYQKELLDSTEFSDDIKIDRFSLFGKSPNGFLFKSKPLRDACLKNIESIKLNKKYQDILFLDQ